MKKMKTNWIFLVVAVLFLAGCGNKTKKTVNNDRMVDGTRIIHFSGYDWRVGNSNDTIQGPGPNYFSDSKDNVWLDDSGNLHLKITHRNGRWNCAKISLMESHGYGTYIFHVASRVDGFDKNVVGGLFTYANDSSEIDIEFSKWAKDTTEDSQFVIQPGWHPGNHHRYYLDQTGEASTHWFNWQPDSVVFASYQGNAGDNPPADQLMTQWTYTGVDNPKPGKEAAKINLWLYRGNPPTDGKEVEMVLSGFEFRK